MKNKLRVSTTSPLIGRLKDHKMDLLIRTIFTKFSCPTYLMEKKNYTHLLNRYLRSTDCIIESTYRFIDKIKNKKFETSSSMVILDVVRLYPTIYINEDTQHIDCLLDFDPTFTQNIKN